MSKPIVYVVDSDRLVLLAVEALLNSAGHEARCFLSPQGLLSYRRRSGEACVVIDLTDPGIDAPAFMRELRTQGRHLPVIMATFMFDPKVAQKWLQQGVFAIVEKPFDGDEFLETIDQALSSPAIAAACSSLKTLAACGLPTAAAPSYPR
jgi:two-component system, LuxR family, response regulator FixJ